MHRLEFQAPGTNPDKTSEKIISISSKKQIPSSIRTDGLEKMCRGKKSSSGFDSELLQHLLQMIHPPIVEQGHV